MFLANVLTVWVEALHTIFSAENPNRDLGEIAVLTEYPLQEIDYPGVWLNFIVGGDVHNAGVDHKEYVDTDDGLHEVFRWRFSGLLEITVGAMGNLERALLVDQISTALAVARIDENLEGELRRTVQTNDLVGMNVVWEAFTISGMAETPGTPWQTDDVIYEATISLTVEGEVVLDPRTGTLVPLSAIVVEVLAEDDPGLPVPGTEGWQ